MIVVFLACVTHRGAWSGGCGYPQTTEDVSFTLSNYNMTFVDDDTVITENIACEILCLDVAGYETVTACTVDIDWEVYENSTYQELEIIGLLTCSGTYIFQCSE